MIMGNAMSVGVLCFIGSVIIAGDATEKQRFLYSAILDREFLL